MTQVILPNRNVTGDNLWSQVETNDDAIATVVNGQIQNDNVAAGADISGSKIAQASVPLDRLGAPVSNAYIADGAVTSAKIGSGAVTSAKIGDGQVIHDKLASGSVTRAKLTSWLAAGTFAATNDTYGLLTVNFPTALNSTPVVVGSPMTAGTFDSTFWWAFYSASSTGAMFAWGGNQARTWFTMNYIAISG